MIYTNLPPKPFPHARRDAHDVNDASTKPLWRIMVHYLFTAGIFCLLIAGRASPVSAQSETHLPLVKGRIVNENGDPVDATIVLMGASKGTTTQPDGEFILKNVAKDAVLRITGVAIEPTEYSVKGKAQLGNITVKMKTTGLSEIVVNKGYYTERQKVSTGNVGRITAKELERQPVHSPLQAMQGRVAGVMIVQQSGVPGSPFYVRVRGTGSIASGNNPLYVVDGVPFNGDMNGVMATGNFFIIKPSTLGYINPQGIESIEVLKDADATAIYGSRGANGVVLITTKKAKPGKTAASFNLSHGVGQVGHFMKLMNKEQYLRYRMQAFRTAGTSPGPLDYDVNGAWNDNPETDWQELLIGGNAAYSNAELSFSGGSANTQFLASGSWHKETTVFPIPSPFQRNAVQLSVNHYSSDRKFNLVLSGMYSDTKSDMPYTNLMEMVTNYPNAPKVYDEHGNLNWEDDWQNPFSRFEVRNKVKTNTIIGSAVASYKIGKAFTAKITACYNQLQFNDNQTFPNTHFRPSLGITNQTSTFGFNNAATWNVEPQLNYEERIGDGNFAALIGTSLQGSFEDYSSVQGSGYLDRNQLGSLAGAASLVKGRYIQSQYKYRGLYLRLNYVWKNNYVLNLTARRDGSSRFAPAYRFRNFGAIGAAWLFAQEDFFTQALPFISYGKLRASYGIVGNDQFTDYRYLDLYNYTSFDVLYQATQGLIPGSLYNPDLQWENNRKAEVGLELGLWKDRIDVVAAYYRNRSDNQLVEMPLPLTTGFSLVWANIPAKVENKGWELTVSSTNFRSKNFTWRSTFNLSDQRNKLLAFPGLEKFQLYDHRLAVGHTINNMKRLKYAGVDPLTGLYTFRTLAGHLTFAARSTPDRYVNVNTDPGLFGGLGNTFTYKGFELDIFFQFCQQLGSTPLVITGQQSPGYFSRTSGQNKTVDVLRAWQKPGDVTDVQRLSNMIGNEAAAYSNLGWSDANLVDASYAKLKNLMLSWQFTPAVCKKLHLQHGRLYVQGQNLFTITHYQGWDPEPTLDQVTLPPLRTMTAGIQFTF